MEIDRRELKYQAREAMKLTQPAFWVVALVYFLMTTGLSSVLDYIPFPSDPVFGISFMALFVSILFSLYRLVVQFGLRLWSLWTYRRLDPGLNSLVQGFSVVGQIIMMELLIFLRLFGWAMLLFLLLIPMAFMGLLAFVTPLLSVAVYIITLRYALAPYLLADRPDDGAAAAVRRSTDLMRGWKWELFKLEFSFIGWALLSVALSFAVEGILLWQSGFFDLVASLNLNDLGSLTNLAVLEELQAAFLAVDGAPLTILLCNLAALPVFLWLTPYRNVTTAGFYDARLQAQRESTPEMPPL